MTAGARLRHPAMCLLSPQLLLWTCNLWRQEQGPQKVDSTKYTHLRTISIKLFDHEPLPSDTPGVTVISDIPVPKGHPNYSLTPPAKKTVPV
jgi:hypothetical protein